MKQLFFIIAYTQDNMYYDDFFYSLQNQNFNDTDVLIINEGVDLSIYISKIESSVFEISCPGSSIVDNRNIALSYAVDNGYDAVFSLDIDDTALAGRNRAIAKGLQSCDVYIHDMNVVSSDNRLISPYFVGKNISTGFTLEDVLYKNPCGFGNMALRTRYVKKALPVPNDIIAIDWWLASVALLHGANALYENKVYSSYRQHDDNFANLRVSSVGSLRRFLTVVESHYRNLVIRFGDILPRRSELEFHLSKIQELLKNSVGYDEVLANHKKNAPTNKELLWWEDVNNLFGRSPK